MSVNKGTKEEALNTKRNVVFSDFGLLFYRAHMVAHRQGKAIIINKGFNNQQYKVYTNPLYDLRGSNARNKTFENRLFNYQSLSNSKSERFKRIHAIAERLRQKNTKALTLPPPNSALALSQPELPDDIVKKIVANIDSVIDYSQHLNIAFVCKSFYAEFIKNKTIRDVNLFLYDFLKTIQDLTETITDFETNVDSSFTFFDSIWRMLDLVKYLLKQMKEYKVPLNSGINQESKALLETIINKVEQYANLVEDNDLLDIYQGYELQYLDVIDDVEFDSIIEDTKQDLIGYARQIFGEFKEMTIDLNSLNSSQHNTFSLIYDELAKFFVDNVSMCISDIKTITLIGKGNEKISVTISNGTSVGSTIVYGQLQSIKYKNTNARNTKDANAMKLILGKFLFDNHNRISVKPFESQKKVSEFIEYIGKRTRAPRTREEINTYFQKANGGCKKCNRKRKIF